MQISTSESKHFRPLMNDLKMIEKIFRVCEEHYLCDEQLQISLMKNATNYRTYFSIKQTFLNKFFENQHSGQCHLVNNLFDKNLVTSLDHLLEDDAKFSSCFNKNVGYQCLNKCHNCLYYLIVDSQGCFTWSQHCIRHNQRFLWKKSWCLYTIIAFTL